MNKNFHYLLIGLTSIFLLSCVSQSDYDKLKEENEALKTELNEVKFGADKLFAQAKTQIDSKDFDLAKETLETLIHKHPDSNQARDAKLLLSSVDQGIKDKEEAIRTAKIESEKADKERLANATKKLRTQFDDVKGITWYYDKSTPQYTNYNSFHIYIGTEKTKRPWLRFRIQYTADDWLFIQSYIIKTDNSTYTIETSYGQVETDNGSDGIWEWFDVKMDNTKYQIVKDIIDSKSVKLRYNGKQYYKDRHLTNSEKQGLRNVLNAYEALGGSLSFE